MVRRMVGVLVAAGQAKLAPDSVGELFKNPLPEIAEWTAPPAGLYLEAVIFDDREAAAPVYRGKREVGESAGGILVWRP